MIDPLTLKPQVFGLDISDLSLKIIQLRKKGKFFDLAYFKEVKIKPGIIRGGEIKKEKALVGVMKKAVSEMRGKKLRTKHVIASLPEEKAYLEVIRMPKMSREDLKSAVIYEAENYVPLPIEKVYLDFQVVPPVHDHPDHLDILIVSLPKKTVDPYLSCLEQAGLKVRAFETESLAISRALIKEEMVTSPVLLVDLGATRSGLIAFSGHSLRFASFIPVSSQGFTEVISKTLKVEMIKAEKLKIKYGLSKKGVEGKKVFDCLIPPLVDLTEQIKKYLDFYQSHASSEHLPPNGKTIDKIILCGGGARLKGLKDFFSSHFEIPIEIGNPWVNVLPKGQKGVTALPLEKSLAYTTALGLALRKI